jgi:hypothetical protein
MPGIRRLEEGHSAVGAIHAKEGKERIRFCLRCDEMIGVKVAVKTAYPLKLFLLSQDTFFFTYSKYSKHD